MQVTTQLTRRDLLLARCHVRGRSSAPYQRFVMSTLVTLVLLAGIVRLIDLRPDPLWLFGAALFGAVVGCVVTEVLEAWLSLRNIEATTGQLGQSIVTLAPEGIYERSAQNTGFGAWSGVRRILDSGSYLLIQTAADELCVIPRRGFRSATAFKLFAAEARQLCADARRGSVSAPG